MNIRMRAKPENEKSISIYQKLILLFFVALIPFFGLSLMANHVAETRLREQSEERMAAQLENIVENYEELHMRAYSWMKVNLMTDYRVLLANDANPLSAFRLGQLVSELFSDLQKLAQISDEISNVAVYMPRTE